MKKEYKIAIGLIVGGVAVGLLSAFGPSIMNAAEAAADDAGLTKRRYDFEMAGLEAEKLLPDTIEKFASASGGTLGDPIIRDMAPSGAHSLRMVEVNTENLPRAVQSLEDGENAELYASYRSFTGKRLSAILDKPSWNTPVVLSLTVDGEGATVKSVVAQRDGLFEIQTYVNGEINETKERAFKAGDVLFDGELNIGNGRNDAISIGYTEGNDNPMFKHATIAGGELSLEGGRLLSRYSYGPAFVGYEMAEGRTFTTAYLTLPQYYDQDGSRLYLNFAKFASDYQDDNGDTVLRYDFDRPQEYFTIVTDDSIRISGIVLMEDR